MIFKWKYALFMPGVLISSGIDVVMAGSEREEEVSPTLRVAQAADADGDGVLGNKDHCPDKPETWNHFKDEDGCPEFDTDNDGLFDAKDKCPNAPESWNQIEDEDGCPEYDHDGDGLIDLNDKCPKKPETWNGTQDDDGCPDGGGEVASAPEPVASPPAQEPPPAAPPTAEKPVEPAPSPEDAALLAELAAATTPVGEPPPQATAPAREAGGSGVSNLFNPAMSLNGLFLGAATNQQGGELGTGIGIQEVEMQFLSNVDPYFGANLIMAMEGGEGLEVEEGYINVTPQPANLNFRFGKMKVPFGRENPLHTHALPFVDRSLAGGTLLGEEGLGEFGLEASYLVPLPFYSLLTVSALNGDSEVLFNAEEGQDLAYFAGLKNLFDVSDNSTLEFGLSYSTGTNTNDTLTQVAGTHLVFKWRPARASTTRSLVAVVEGLYATYPERHYAKTLAPTREEEEVETAPSQGVGGYAYLQWQLARRWYVAGRLDYLGIEPELEPTTRQSLPSSLEATTRESLVLTLAPTEFSALRVQGNLTQPEDGGDPLVDVFLQFNFTLGAHPAHSY